MIECKKCGAIMPDDGKDNICEECKQKTMKIIKVATPIVAGAIIAVIFNLDSETNH